MKLLRWEVVAVFLVVMTLVQPCMTLDSQSNSFLTSATDLTLIIDFGNDTVLTYYTVEGNNVLEATNATVEVQNEWYADSAFVTSIEGVFSDADSGLWWQYWVNDELGPVAANKFLVQDGDVISWKRLPPEMTSEPQNDPSLLWGIVILSLIGVSFLGILFKMKR